MTVEEFVAQLAVNNLYLNASQIDRFQSYADLLREWNDKMNLTAITAPGAVYEKHFYDSILPFVRFQPAGTLCDVGSGAGFPGLAVKIVFPELQVTLLEPVRKKTLFLNEVVTKLGLEGIRIVNERAEDYSKANREAFDWVTARAVANLAVLAELCLPLVKLNGHFMALKGSGGLEEYQQARNALSVLGAELADTGRMRLNDETERYNLLFIKSRRTPVNYPRSYAAIKKHPL